MYMSNKKRNIILMKTYGRCAYCGKPISDAVTFDHVTSRNKNGTSRYVNLVPCCAACNIAKGSMTLDEFKSSEYGKSLCFRNKLFFERLNKKKFEHLLDEV